MSRKKLHRCEGDRRQRKLEASTRDRPPEERGEVELARTVGRRRRTRRTQRRRGRGCWREESKEHSTSHDIVKKLREQKYQQMSGGWNKNLEIAIG
jgi:hypothetical protein